MAAKSCQPALGTIGRCQFSSQIRPKNQSRSQPSLPIRAQKKSSNVDQAPTTPESISQATFETLTRAATIATLATAVLAAVPQAAVAGEWKPRRNTRRIRDEILETGARNQAALREAAAKAAAQVKRELQAAAQSEPAQELGAMFNNAKKAAKKSYKKLQRAVQGESVYSVGASGRPDPSVYYSGSSRSSAVQEGSYLGWWAVGIALLGVAYAKWGDGLHAFFRTRRGKEKGKWVRDRSLGGKLVFIPDADDEVTIPRPLWQDDDDFVDDLAMAAAARAGAPAGATPAAAQKQQQQEELEPIWWAPPAPVGYVSASRKEDLTKDAKSTIRYLEDCKLQGQEYPLSSIVTLRRICHEGGGLKVRTSTESGRDAIFRAAVKFAMDATMRPKPSSDLGGYEPGRFVSGLAVDLNIPQKRAITITHGEIAATCRSTLIDAEAAFRAGDQNRVLYSLGKLVAILEAFQLPAGSPEAELVGRTIQAQTTIEFRRAIFLAAGSASLDIAPLVAEMMGFEPNLVMDQLKMQIAVANSASEPPSSGPSEEE